MHHTAMPMTKAQTNPENWCLLKQKRALALFSIPLLHLPRPQGNRCQPPHSPFQEQPCLREPQRTLPPPCPLQHTSERKPAWHTSGRTCGPTGPKPLLLPLCC